MSNDIISNNPIKEFYVHKDELDEEKIKLLHEWCLEAGAVASNEESKENWCRYLSNDCCAIYGIYAGCTRSYINIIIEEHKGEIIPFSEVRTHLGLEPLQLDVLEDNPSSCTTTTIEYVSAGLTSPVEMMQRLTDGEVFYWKDRDDVEKYYHEGGDYVYDTSEGINNHILDWSVFSDLLIKKETFWYDNIDPENPPLCKVWDNNGKDVRLILAYSEGNYHTPYGSRWKNATPTGKFKKDFM